LRALVSAVRDGECDSM